MTTNNMNMVILVGNVGDCAKTGGRPQLKALSDGTHVCNFSVGTHEEYTNDQKQKVKTTDWHQLVAWGPTADIAATFLQTGSFVLIEGRLKSRKYQNTQFPTVTHKVTEVKVKSIKFLDKAPTTNAHPAQEEPKRFVNQPDAVRVGANAVATQVNNNVVAPVNLAPPAPEGFIMTPNVDGSYTMTPKPPANGPVTSNGPVMGNGVHVAETY